MKTFNLLFLFLFHSVLCAEFSPLFPPPLKKGDTIAIIAPASFPEEEPKNIARAIKKLIERGYRVKIASNLTSHYGYLAGTDFDRAKALMDAWKDPQVKAIWCYRGGYGCMRILDRLDFRFMKENPKIFIGMSDVTALHAAIIKETGMITFLGPNFNGVYGKDEKNDNLYNERELWWMIAGDPRNNVRNRQFPNPNGFPSASQVLMTIQEGVAKGRLMGGTLSLVVSMIGTPWEIDTKGKILVLEEVQEEPFRIDRMLCQLKHAGKLEGLAGVILCSWKACGSKRPDTSLSLDQIFREYFRNAPYPVLWGFPSGHIKDQATLPLNAMVELDATKKTLRLLEVPVK